MASHALILNASFEPLNVVSWQRAIQLLFQGKVEVIEESDRHIRTVRLSMKVPSVLRLLNYIPLKKHKSFIRFSRQNVFLRDQNKCQYCGKVQTKSNLTLDHVVPVVQGGKKDWKNIVTSCRKCNQKKGGRTPSQSGMKLIKRPSEPKWLPNMTLQLSASFLPDSWKIYVTTSKK